MFFFSSVQLFFIGIIGEYIGAIHTELTLHLKVLLRKRKVIMVGMVMAKILQQEALRKIGREMAALLEDRTGPLFNRLSDQMECAGKGGVAFLKQVVYTANIDHGGEL